MVKKLLAALYRFVRFVRFDGERSRDRDPAGTDAFRHGHRALFSRPKRTIRSSFTRHPRSALSGRSEAAHTSRLRTRRQIPGRRRRAHHPRRYHAEIQSRRSGCGFKCGHRTHPCRDRRIRRNERIRVVESAVLGRRHRAFHLHLLAHRQRADRLRDRRCADLFEAKTRQAHFGAEPQIKARVAVRR